MSKTIQLRHVNHTVPFRIEFFYDGHARSENGVVSIDSSKIQHLRAAFFRGYQITPEGKRLNSFADLDKYIAESEEENGREPEGTIRGGQSPTTNRVRARQRNSRS